MEADDEYFISLQDQRVFGAGIKRKRVTFIPAQSSNPPQSPQAPNPLAISNRYLSIVLPNVKSTEEPSIESPASLPTTTKSTAQTPTALNALSPRPRPRSPSPLPFTCSICHLPFLSTTTTSSSSIATMTPHEATIAHQVCLTHSHPPSHLDRSRPGLKYLSSYGWDPDSRLGLGAAGGGIQIPVKGKIKNDTVGLGARVRKKKRGKKEESLGVKKKNTVERLDAKQTRRMEEVGRRKGERLREMFYQSEDVERYLGGGSG